MHMRGWNLAVIFLLMTGLVGCGGSGGGPSIPGTSTVTTASTTSTSQDLSLILALGVAGTDYSSFASDSPSERGRATLQSGCPVVTDNRATPSSSIPNPWVVTINYGSGCSSNSLNKTIAGSETTTFTNFNLSAGTQGGTAVVQFNNFSVNGQAIAGTITVSVTGVNAATLTSAITVSNGSSSRQITTSLLLATTGTGASRTLLVNGSGTYTDSKLGTFDLTFNNLLFGSTCPEPNSGSVQISGTDHLKAVVSFGSSCGGACATIEGVSVGCFTL